jgi:hypothetical protein
MAKCEMKSGRAQIFGIGLPGWYRLKLTPSSLVSPQ